MIATLWRKHWMELRGLWLFALVFIEFPALYFAHQAQAHPGHAPPPPQGFLFLFSIMVLGVFPPRFAGTGLSTSQGLRPNQRTDPSLLFTLSLPLRRRTLFFSRAAFGLVVLEVAAALGLIVAAGLFVHLGGSWKIVRNGLWILLFMLPIHSMDSLLATRFTEATTMQIHFGYFFALLLIPRLLGVNTQTVLTALSGVSPLALALSALLITVGLAIITIWKLDRQDF
jgi:hypothetical protein